MPTTAPRLTPVCTEAQTPEDHAGCSGPPACLCRCHLPELDPVPVDHSGRNAAPEKALDEMRRVRDQLRARREAGEPE